MAAQQGETAAFGPSTERLRARATELVAAVPAWVWLTVLMGGSWAIRAVLAVRDPSPWIFQDELLYSELAKSFAATGHFAVHEVPVPGAGGFGVVYPVLIAPAWKLFQNVPTAYEAAKIINSLVMSLGAIPVYLLARRMVSKAWALAAAVLALTLPGMVYTSVIMTENAFYPVFLFWVLAVVQALERPTVLRQLAAVALTFVAYLTRSQGAVLVPALVTAIVLLVVLDALSDERGFWRAALARTRAFWATWLTLVIGAGGFLLLEVGIRGKTFSTAVLGGYTILTTSSYSANDVARWFLYHSAELDLAVGVLPFAAFFLLVIAAFRRMPPSREARVFAVVALSASVWLLAEVAAFASSPFGLQILERNDFYLEPLFLIALVVWAAGVLPRVLALDGRGGGGRCRPRWARAVRLVHWPARCLECFRAPSALEDRGARLGDARPPYRFRSRRGHSGRIDLRVRAAPAGADRTAACVPLPRVGDFAGRGQDERGLERLALRRHPGAVELDRSRGRRDAAEGGGDLERSAGAELRGAVEQRVLQPHGGTRIQPLRTAGRPA